MIGKAKSRCVLSSFLYRWWISTAFRRGFYFIRIFLPLLFVLVISHLPESGQSDECSRGRKMYFNTFLPLFISRYTRKYAYRIFPSYWILKLNVQIFTLPQNPITRVVCIYKFGGGGGDGWREKCISLMNLVCTIKIKIGECRLVGCVYANSVFCLS